MSYTKRYLEWCEEQGLVDENWEPIVADVWTNKEYVDRYHAENERN